jgi:hypothetical protein
VDGNHDAELLSIERGCVTDKAEDVLAAFNHKASEISLKMKNDALILTCTDSSGVLRKARRKMLDDNVFCLVGACLSHQTNIFMAEVYTMYTPILNVLKNSNVVCSFFN